MVQAEGQKYHQVSPRRVSNMDFHPTQARHSRYSQSAMNRIAARVNVFRATSWSSCLVRTFSRFTDRPHDLSHGCSFPKIYKSTAWEEPNGAAVYTANYECWDHRAISDMASLGTVICAFPELE